MVNFNWDIMKRQTSELGERLEALEPRLEQLEEQLEAHYETLSREGLHFEVTMGKVFLIKTGLYVRIRLTIFDDCEDLGTVIAYVFNLPLEELSLERLISLLDNAFEETSSSWKRIINTYPDGLGGTE